MLPARRRPDSVDSADGGIQVQQTPQSCAGDFLAGVLGELRPERTHELMRMGEDEAGRAWYSRFGGAKPNEGRFRAPA